VRVHDIKWYGALTYAVAAVREVLGGVEGNHYQLDDDSVYDISTDKLEMMRHFRRRM
jgi:hypothetical protein